MIINLTEIPSFWLTCNKTADRWPRMENMLKAVNIPAKKIIGPETTPYTLGVAKGHSKALYSPEFFAETRFNPILIIEDDAAITSHYQETIEVPNDTDALYLGVSIYGRNFGETVCGGAVCKKEGNLVRIFNMLGLHAVVYISGRYKAHVEELMNNFDGVGGCDDRIAETMHDFKVLAVPNGFWYQADGHSEFATTQTLNCIF